MEFCFDTVYTPKSMAVMAKALRKTIRKRHSKRSHLFGFFVVFLGILLAFSASEISFKSIITVAVVLFILLALVFEDHINGYIAFKRILPGTTRSIVRFHQEGYHTETVAGSSDFPYSNIIAIAEDQNYYVLIFSSSHAQLYDKRTISGGTHSDFSAFISEKTGCSIQTL